MYQRDIEQSLLKVFEHMPVIDAHEHMPPEAERLALKVDFSTLFSHYCQTDLMTSGMSEEEWLRFQSPETDVDEKWTIFAPYWPCIRFMSYPRPALIAAKEFYGCEDFTEQTYPVITERIQAANQPGIYDRIIRQKCNIKAILTQIWAMPQGDRDLLIPILPDWDWVGILPREEMIGRAQPFGVTVTGLEDYLTAMRLGLESWKAQGVVGIKHYSVPLCDPSKEEASGHFDRLMRGSEFDAHLLMSYLSHEVFRLAGELDFIVPVHCAMHWNTNNDCYSAHPRNLVSVLSKHPQTTFDLYHGGIPWPRDLAVIAKAYPNACLNLCWAHVMSPRMVQSFLDEWLDLVPVNKITGFGGDYRWPVEKVYGHLLMAKENFARVFARRIADGLMTEAQAIETVQQFLFDNPKRLYKLEI